MTLTLEPDYRRLILESVPMLDVRAPVEFEQGAMPGAANLPLLTDEERHEVGLCHRQEGPDAAVALGHRIVQGPVRETRLEGWLQWRREHPDGVLYCFRGGLRSQTVQAWMHEAGVDLPRVAGGYKALRRFLLQSLETLSAELPLWLLGGPTGAGKTRLIAARPEAVDLEGLAHHRGSAFGRRPGGQPCQADFENRLAMALLQAQARLARDPRPLLLEDESKLIGHRLIPPVLFARMTRAPRILIEEPLASRVAVTLEDYVLAPLAEYDRLLGPDAAFDALGAALLEALDRIRNRLGGLRHTQLRQQLETALAAHRRTGSGATHRDWIERLLVEYYDPMYAHARQRRAADAPVLFTGSREEVIAFLNDRPALPRAVAGGG
jgi:tRNA 2-selenouridine synthase